MRVKVTNIVSWIQSCGQKIGMLFSAKEKLPPLLSPLEGTKVMGRLSGREIHRLILLRVMRDLSEERYCSGWMIGLEHYLWHLALQKNTEEGQILMYCAEMSGGWWMWDDSKDGPLFVPLVAWMSAYNDKEIMESI